MIFSENISLSPEIWGAVFELCNHQTDASSTVEATRPDGELIDLRPTRSRPDAGLIATFG